MIRKGMIVLVCSILLHAMEQEMVVIDAQQYPHSALQQRERHKRELYTLFASLISKRNYQALKPHIRMLKEAGALHEMLTYVPKNSSLAKTVLQLSQEAAERGSISIIRERLLYGLLAAAVPVGFLAKLIACPPDISSVSCYTAMTAMAAAAYMVRQVLYDTYFLKDYQHNNALQCMLKFRQQMLDDRLYELHERRPNVEDPYDALQKLFCELRESIQKRNLYNVRRLLEKTEHPILYALLCQPNGQGHKPLVEIARQYSKKKVVCDLHHKRSRIVTAIVFLALVFVDGYINAFELYNESRACSINRNPYQGKLALGFTLSSFAITFLYFINQISTVYNRFDQHRAHNDALRIYKKILAATERAMLHPPATDPHQDV